LNIVDTKHSVYGSNGALFGDNGILEGSVVVVVVVVVAAADAPAVQCL